MFGEGPIRRFQKHKERLKGGKKQGGEVTKRFEAGGKTGGRGRARGSVGAIKNT